MDKRMKRIKRKSTVQLAEEIELELRERITYLEEQIRAVNIVLMATSELVKYLAENREGN
jgi:hypothetical protein